MSTETAGPEKLHDSSINQAWKRATVALAVLSLILVCLLVWMQASKSHYVTSGGTFEGKVTAISESRSSLCVSNADHEDGRCAFPVELPSAEPVQVGDLVQVTVIQLAEGDSTTEAFYVTRN